MNLTTPEPALSIRSMRGEYRGLRDYPVVFFVDTEGREHGAYSFTFDVAEERFKSGKNAVMNHPDILWLMPHGNMTVINSFMNDTVKAVHYGINTESPDRIYVSDFDEGYHGDDSYVVDFVSLYTEFTDGTSSDIHVKEGEGSRRGKNSAPMYDI